MKFGSLNSLLITRDAVEITAFSTNAEVSSYLLNYQISVQLALKGVHKQKRECYLRCQVYSVLYTNRALLLLFIF